MKRIKSISISNSRFFTSDFNIEFSEKLNCIMGSRGTGKSTIVEFLRSLQTPSDRADKTTTEYLLHNLDAGQIKVVYETVDGDVFEGSKSTAEIASFKSTATDTVFRLEDVLNKIECDIYPAQSIEHIGRNPQARLELIDRMVANDIQPIVSEIEKKQIDLAKNAKDLRSLRLELSALEEQKFEFATLDDDLDALNKQRPTDLDEKDKARFEEQSELQRKRVVEKQYLSDLRQDLTGLVAKAHAFDANLQTCSDRLAPAFEPANAEYFSEFTQRHSAAFKRVREATDLILEIMNVEVAAIEKDQHSLETLHLKQNSEFEAIQQAFQSNKEYFAKRNRIETRINERQIIEAKIKSRLKEYDEAKNERSRQLSDLKELSETIFGLRKKAVKSLNDQFNDGLVRILISKGGVTDEYDNKLRAALKGKGMQYNTLVPILIKNLPPMELAAIVHGKDMARLRELSGFDEKRSNAIIEALHETDAIFEIEALYCPDKPDFHLRIDSVNAAGTLQAGDYRRSEDLSTGQRCTAVLPIVFAVSDNPLIIDQPEDNLDNKYITESIQNIVVGKKATRQLIFITHNPNIPVLSDAEMNLFLEYSDSKSKVLAFGSVNDVKEQIIKLLEGGREAFERRNQIYGSEATDK